MVQTVENILQKCDETKEDSYLAFLYYPTTLLDRPLKPMAEQLTNRKFKTIPVCQRALLNSTVHKAVQTKFITHQEKQAHFYNQNAGPSKKPLEADHSQTWKPGVIIKLAKQARSYNYIQIQHYKCHISKNTVPTETRYNCSK